jgi:hypothetical protein
MIRHLGRKGINATQVYNSKRFYFKMCVYASTMHVGGTAKCFGQEWSGQLLSFTPLLWNWLFERKIAFILESWFIGSMKPEDRRMPESTIGGPRKVVRKDGGEGNCYKTPHTIFPGCLLRHDRYLFPSVAR